MRIALDATYSIGDQLSGVGIYSRELLSGLAAAHPEIELRFCYRPHRYFRSFRYRLPSNAKRQFLLEPLGPRSVSLFHGLNQRLPRIPLRRSVVTFHDLFVLSGDYSTPEFRARFARQARDAVARADAVIAVSAFTKSQLVDLMATDPRKVHIVHHGVRKLALRPLEREPVILHVGAIQKRKNITRLIEAFESVSPPWRLVLAGSAGYGAGEILARIDASPARSRILVTGYIGAQELSDWYARASIFAFPSLDEGFGMPVLEAMIAGVPVVTSNRSALPEVAGQAAIQVSPEDTVELAAALSNLITNQELRADLIRRGSERIKIFSWEKAVFETWSVYMSVLD